MSWLVNSYISHLVYIEDLNSIKNIMTNNQTENWDLNKNQNLFNYNKLLVKTNGALSFKEK